MNEVRNKFGLMAKGKGNLSSIYLETRMALDNSRKSVTWSAVPDAPMLVYVGMR